MSVFHKPKPQPQAAFLPELYTASAASVLAGMVVIAFALIALSGCASTQQEERETYYVPPAPKQASAPTPKKATARAATVVLPAAAKALPVAAKPTIAPVTIVPVIDTPKVESASPPPPVAKPEPPVVIPPTVDPAADPELFSAAKLCTELSYAAGTEAHDLCVQRWNRFASFGGLE
jgi:glucose/arabinose dehydrogenase